MNRAYTTFFLRGVDEERRELEGFATTPTTDRMGDIVEPDGAEFKLPLPLLWQHDSRQPIGHVVRAKVTKDGIEVKAQLTKINEPGKLKDRLDEAWQSIKSGLVRGLSIGFRSLEDAEIKGTWGIRFIKWEWLELSAVTIAANEEASITAIKSADQKLRAASGATQQQVKAVAITSPGASGSTKKGVRMKTIAERIKEFEATRAAKAARLEEIQNKASEENRTKDGAEREEFDTLTLEIQAIDGELKDLDALAKLNIAKAAPAPMNNPNLPRGSTIVSVRPNIEKGIAFVRYVKALALAKGNMLQALAYAQQKQQWMDQTPEVVEALKATVAAGTTSGAAWADDLVYNQNLVADFIEYLRPMTIIGRLTGLRRVPFNVRVASATSGSTSNWVGEGNAIPVSKLQTDNVSLGIAKAAGLVVITKELAMSSAPSAELLVRQDLAAAIVEFLDKRFVDPNYGEVTNVSPASITYNVTPVTPTGTNAAAFRTDMRTLFETWIDANMNPAGGAWIMSHTTALAIQLMMNSLGQPEFPGVNMNGGVLLGLPVIASQSAFVSGSPNYGDMIILAMPSEIMLADEGGLVVEASDQASIEMSDAPAHDSDTPTAAQLVSMFQTESVAIKATRFINWKKRRSTAVAFIRTAAYS